MLRSVVVAPAQRSPDAAAAVGRAVVVDAQRRGLMDPAVPEALRAAIALAQPGLKLIRANEYTHRPQRLIDEDDVETCSCRRAGGSGRCCTDAACENFSTQTECIVGFCSKTRCGNQRLQRRLWAAVEVIDAGPKGFGLRATKPIARGALIAEYCGEVIDEAEYQARMEELARTTRHFYLMSLGRGEYLDAGRHGSVARFINHSCAPNARVEVWAVGGESVAGVFAADDIAAGAEVCFNYGWDRAVRRMVCYCGAPTCAGYIGLRSDAAYTADALPEGRFREPTLEERRGGAALIGEWVQLLWEGDTGLGDAESGGSDAGGGASEDGGGDERRQRRRAARRTMTVTVRGCWYTGRVAAFDAATGTHTVRYAADGEVCDGETLAQPECTWRILERVRSRADAEELSRRLRAERAAATATAAACGDDGGRDGGVASDDGGGEDYDGDGGAVVFYDDVPGGASVSSAVAAGAASGTDGRRVISTLVVPRRRGGGGDGGVNAGAAAPSGPTPLSSTAAATLQLGEDTAAAPHSASAWGALLSPVPTPLSAPPQQQVQPFRGIAAGGDSGDILYALSREKALSDVWRSAQEAQLQSKEHEARAAAEKARAQAASSYEGLLLAQYRERRAKEAAAAPPGAQVAAPAAPPPSAAGGAVRRDVAPPLDASAAPAAAGQPDSRLAAEEEQARRRRREREQRVKRDQERRERERERERAAALRRRRAAFTPPSTAATPEELGTSWLPGAAFPFAPPWAALRGGDIAAGAMGGSGTDDGTSAALQAAAQLVAADATLSDADAVLVLVAAARIAAAAPSHRCAAHAAAGRADYAALCAAAPSALAAALVQAAVLTVAATGAGQTPPPTLCSALQRLLRCELSPRAAGPAAAPLSDVAPAAAIAEVAAAAVVPHGAQWLPAAAAAWVAALRRGVRPRGDGGRAGTAEAPGAALATAATALLRAAAGGELRLAAVPAVTLGVASVYAAAAAVAAHECTGRPEAAAGDLSAQLGPSLLPWRLVLAGRLPLRAAMADAGSGGTAAPPGVDATAGAWAEMLRRLGTAATAAAAAHAALTVPLLLRAAAIGADSAVDGSGAAAMSSVAAGLVAPPAAPEAAKGAPSAVVQCSCCIGCAPVEEVHLIGGDGLEGADGDDAAAAAASQYTILRSITVEERRRGGPAIVTLRVVALSRAADATSPSPVDAPARDGAGVSDLPSGAPDADDGKLPLQPLLLDVFSGFADAAHAMRTLALLRRLHAARDAVEPSRSSSSGGAGGASRAVATTGGLDARLRAARRGPARGTSERGATAAAPLSSGDASASTSSPPPLLHAAACIPLSADTWFGEAHAWDAVVGGAPPQPQPRAAHPPRSPHVLLPVRLLSLTHNDAGGDGAPALALAYEHCPHSLRGLLLTAALSLCDGAVVRRAAYQLLRGAWRAHERGVAHGRLSPAAVLFSRDGVLRIGAWEGGSLLAERAASKVAAAWRLTAAPDGGGESDARGIARRIAHELRRLAAPGTGSVAVAPAAYWEWGAAERWCDPAYSAPEELLALVPAPSTGAPSLPTPGADAWSLGALLVALFAGVDAFAPDPAVVRAAGEAPSLERLAPAAHARAAAAVGVLVAIEAVAGPLALAWPMLPVLQHASGSLAAAVAAALVHVRAAGAAPPPAASAASAADASTQLRQHLTTALGLTAEQVALVAPLLTVNPGARGGAREALSAAYFTPASGAGAAAAGDAAGAFTPAVITALSQRLGAALLAGGEDWYAPGSFPPLAVATR